MPVLPVPMIIALLLAGVLAYRLAKRETHATLLMLIGLCAFQSALVALVHYYGLTALQPVQPVVAMLIPPAAWLAFTQATDEEDTARIAGPLHLLGPGLAIVCLAFDPALLDGLIPLSFISYGVAMLARLGGGEDGLLHSRLENSVDALFTWRIVGISLIASALCDVLIAIALANGHRGILLWVSSIVSSASLLGLGLLSLTRAMETRRDEQPADARLSVADTDRDKEIIRLLESHLKAHKPYLDPELTLARLARRLLVPAKQLSAAINRIEGENVSRYINRHRIDEACRKLAAGQSVTGAMLDSGFNTKSNFNREFQRVRGMSPSKWLQMPRLNALNKAATSSGSNEGG